MFLLEDFHQSDEFFKAWQTRQTGGCQKLCVWVCVSYGWMQQKAHTLKVVISHKRLWCEMSGATVKIDKYAAQPRQQRTADQ